MIGNLIFQLPTLNKKPFLYWLHLNYLEEIKQHSNTTFIKSNSRDQIKSKRANDIFNLKLKGGADHGTNC